MSDQRWDDEPGVSPQGYIIGCTGGCACQCDLPECGCHRTTRDTTEAALAAALARTIVGHPVGKHEAPQQYDSCSGDDCRMPDCYAAAILAALPSGWCGHDDGLLSDLVEERDGERARADLAEAEIARLTEAVEFAAREFKRLGRTNSHLQMLTALYPQEADDATWDPRKPSRYV